MRAVYWSATRGEGGQNRIGPYREEALGIFRTWESLAARAVDQSQCLFGPFYDFGYSKNAAGALAKWGGDNLVRELVRAIRLVQPQVIVARWLGRPATSTATTRPWARPATRPLQPPGDPGRFPELRAQGLAAWQPLKFYHSLDNSGGDLSAGGAVDTRPPAIRPWSGTAWSESTPGSSTRCPAAPTRERAWLAYNKHQTQAMGLAPGPGGFLLLLCPA